MNFNPSYTCPVCGKYRGRSNKNEHKACAKHYTQNKAVAPKHITVDKRRDMTSFVASIQEASQ